MQRRATQALRLAALLLVLGPAIAFKATNSVAEAEGEKSELATAAWGLLRAISDLGDTQRAQLANVRADAEGRFVHSVPAGAGPTDKLADTYHDDTHVVITLPRELVKTSVGLRDVEMSHFLTSPALQKHQAKNKLALPSSFIFALFLLYQRFAVGKPHGVPLWQAYLAYHDAARTAEHATWRWSDAELEKFNQPRMVESAQMFRNASVEHYDKLLWKIMEAFPKFFPMQQISGRVYRDALAVALSQNVQVDGVEGDVLLPFPMRLHPKGSIAVEEVEQERLGANGEVRSSLLVNLVTATGAAPKDGQEMIVRHPNSNDELLLLCGYMWDGPLTQSVPLRMWIDATVKPLYDRRLVLLKQAGLNETQDFSLGSGEIDPDMMIWSRVMLGNVTEIEDAESAEAFRSPMCEATERDVYSNLLQSLQSVRITYYHEVEEDDFILADPNRELPPRERLAVRHRRASKLLLDEGTEKVIDMLQAADLKAKREANEKPALEGGRGGGYSNSKSRKLEERKLREKERRREEVRRKREAKQAAAEAEGSFRDGE